MTDQEYIISKLHDLITEFPYVSCRYENHKLSHSHFIEIEPLDFYESNEEFKMWEENIVFEFIDLFPDQTISFISKNAIVGLDHIDYELNSGLDILSDFSNPIYNQINVPVNWSIPSSSTIIFNTNVIIPRSDYFHNFLENIPIRFNAEPYNLSPQVVIWDKSKISSLVVFPTIEDTLENKSTDNYSYAMAA